jgi:hypothetical protein
MLKVCKKGLSVLLALALILTLMPVSVLASGDVWDGQLPAADEDASYSGGSGTKDDPFIIATAEDLAQLSSNVYSFEEYSKGKHFKQTADIVLNSPDDFATDENGIITGSDPDSSPHKWLPIGYPLYDEYGYSPSFSKAFQGSYDGGGHLVSGIYIDYIDDETVKCKGLFGLIMDASIENIGVETSYIRGDDHTGGLVGYSEVSSVEKSFFRGTVKGYNDVGGIVGSNYSGIVSDCFMTGFVSGGPHTSSIFSNAGGIVGGNYDGIVEYCNNTATVAGDYNVGGIVGSNRTGAVFRCYNAGVVYGRYDAVGGISGKNESGLNRSCFNKETVTADGYNAGGIAGVISQGAVEDCYNISPVTGEDNVGGVVGKNSDGWIKTSYNIGKAEVGDFVGGVVGKNSDGWIKTSYNIGKAEVGDFVGGVLGRMDEGHVESCYYLDTCVPAYSSSYGTKLTDEEMWDEENFAGFDFVNIWAIEDGFNYPRFIYELPTELGGDSAVWDGTVAEGFAGGEGTKNKPYLIENAAQLAYFAKTVNEGNSYAGKYIKLDNEIILNRKDVPNWTLNASPWTPIGADSPFEGYFDGDDYTIRGVYIDSVRFNLGIFGQNKGTVVNLGVEPYYFRGYFNVAAVVAHNDGGLVDNSYNLGDIYGCLFIGGVVGLNEEGTVRYCYNEGAVFGYEISGGVVGANDEGIVTDCYNSGAVGGDWGVGGVVGLNEEGTVRYCYNEGAVFGYKVSGGVAGNMHFSMLRDCYNLGAVSGYSTVGGIFGYSYLSHTDSCYNRGTVTASDDFGGIAGHNEASTLVNCYYLDTTVSDPTNDFGKALTEAQMLQKDSYEGFDFEAIWDIGPEADYPYPTLRNLTVTPAEPIAVTGVSLNKSSLTLKTGKTGTLTAIIEPADATDKAVRWTSSRSSIATVDKNGVVTALRPGTVTIKVTTVDGGFSATCTVKVEPVKVTGISPDKPSFTLKAGETGTLTAIVKPADAFSKDVLWLTSDYTVAEVSPQGVVRALKAGTAIISATTVDGGYTAYFTVTVTQDNIAVKPGSSYGTNKHDTILYNVSPGTTVNELLNNLAGGSFEVRNAKGEKLSGNAVIGTGAVVNLIADGKVIDSLLISVRGDIDGDGKVTAADARLVLRHVAKLQTLSELEMHSADIDGESCIKAADARLILRAAAKLETL